MTTRTTNDPHTTNDSSARNAKCNAAHPCNSMLRQRRQRGLGHHRVVVDEVVLGDGDLEAITHLALQPLQRLNVAGLSAAKVQRMHQQVL